MVGFKSFGHKKENAQNEERKKLMLTQICHAYRECATDRKRVKENPKADWEFEYLLIFIVYQPVETETSVFQYICISFRLYSRIICNLHGHPRFILFSLSSCCSTVYCLSASDIAPV